MSGQLRILEGATFCICDDLGDLHGNVEGLFAQDTRFLSSLKLTINGKRPLLLSSDKIEYFSAAFFMRNPLADGLAPDALSIRRERFVGDGTSRSTSSSGPYTRLTYSASAGSPLPNGLFIVVAPLVGSWRARYDGDGAWGSGTMATWVSACARCCWPAG